MMKKRKAINIILTIIMVFTNVLTPQMINAIADMQAEDPDESIHMQSVDNQEGDIVTDGNTDNDDLGSGDTAIISASETGVEGETTDEPQPVEDEVVDGEPVDVQSNSPPVEGEKTNIIERVKNFGRKILAPLNEQSGVTITENLLTELQIILNGIELNSTSEDFTVNPEAVNKFEFTYSLVVPDNVVVNAGDNYILTIPEIIKGGIVNGQPLLDNDGLELAKYSINENNEIIIIFSEGIETSDDKSFDINFGATFIDNLFEDKEEVDFDIPLIDGKSFKLTFKPEQQPYTGEDKKTAGDQYILNQDGTRTSVDRNPEYVEWTVRVNDSMENIDSAKVIDTLGNNLEFEADGFKVERIIRNYKNEEIGREEATDLTPIPTETGFELDLRSISDAYDITYTTKLIRPDGGGELEIKNNATIILDGNETPVSDKITGIWSEDIETVTKKGSVSSDNKDIINWTVQYNFGKQDLGTVTLTDTLSEGEVILGTIKVQQVDTDIDGNITSVIDEDVDVEPSKNGNIMTIPNLDANGKAYNITFSSKVPGGLNEDIVNTIIDNVPGSKGAEDDVPVNTIPTGGKVGEQKVDEDGNPYIEWTITLNSEKIDVGSINILDLFNGDHLEFNVSETSLYELSSDEEAKTNFTISEHRPSADDDDQRVGFRLNINNAGPHEYKFVYRTYYTVSGMKEPDVANEAEILFEQGGVGIGESKVPAVSLEGPQPGITKSARYIVKESDIGTQEIEWTVTFNQSKILLNAGSQIIDEFTSDNYELIPGSQTVSLESGYTFTPGLNNKGFVLKLDEGTNEIITLTYRTTTDDTTNLAHTNKATIKWQGRDDEDSETIDHRAPSLHKTGKTIINEDGTKQIDWVIDINKNQQVIYDYVLTDTNKPAGSTIKNIVVTKDGNKLTESVDYKLSYPETGKFIIEIAKLDAVPYQVTYSAELTPEQEKNLIRNEVNAIFRGGNNNQGYTVPNPVLEVKKEVIDHVEKTEDGDFINWKITANELKTVNGNENINVNLVDATLTDTIPTDQKLVPGSVKAVRADDDSIFVEAEDIKDNSFTIKLPNGPYEWIVTLQTQILRHPSVHPTEADRYTNTVELSNKGYSPKSDTAYVDYFSQGDQNSITKAGVFNDDTENVDWTLELNPLGLKIVNPKIQDTLDVDKEQSDHYYVPDSFEITDGTKPLDKSSYDLILNDSNTSFELSFSDGEINTPIHITYSTRVREDLIGGYSLTNKVQLFGGEPGLAIEDSNTSASGYQWFFGGGGSGRTLDFTLNKVNKYGQSVQGAKFKLARVNASGVEIPLDSEVITKEDGRFELKGVRAGRYIVREELAPTGYKSLEEPVYIIVGYGSAEPNDFIVTVTDKDWNPLSNDEIATANGNELRIVNQFKTRDIEATKIWKGVASSGNRPDAYLQLYRKVNDEDPGEKVSNPILVSESNSAVVTWSDVEEYTSTGEPYQFFVKESDKDGNDLLLENYDQEYATVDGELDYMTIINTNNEIVSVKGTKIWVDYSNKHNTRPEDGIIVQLVRNGVDYGNSFIVTDDNDGDDVWAFEYKDLPKYDLDGTEINYTFREVTVPELYNSTIDDTGKNITNTYLNIETINVSGKKKWVDFGNRLETRPKDGIKIQLLQNSVDYGNPIIVTDDNDGDDEWTFEFTNLPKYDEFGDSYEYSVKELPVDGYKASYDDDGNITNQLIPDISVSVGDYVWFDANEDGLQDDTDIPLENIVLTIENEDGTPVTDIEGLPVGPQVTDENGHYSFDKLPADATYVVRIDREASAIALKDYAPTKEEEGNDSGIDSSTWLATSKHLVEDEERDPTLDFGFIKKRVSIGDYVWLDNNKDGLQDDEEPGIPGVVLKVTDKDGNPVTDVYGNPVEKTTTDRNGYYSFDNLPANNTYIVTIVQEDSKEALKGLTTTLEEAGDDNEVDSSTWSATSRELTENEECDPTLDFGFYKERVSVGDYVWIDVNRDGLQDDTDIPLEGVTLILKDSEGNIVTKDVDGNPIENQVTDENGYYSFDNLPSDTTYTVEIDKADFEMKFPSLVPTLENEGERDKDSSTWTAQSVLLEEDGQRDPTLDFGFVRKRVSLGDYVWIDVNRTGLQDESDIYLEGVTLILKDEEGNIVTEDVDGNPVVPQVTDKNGYYIFKNLPADRTYTVEVDRVAFERDFPELMPTLEDAGERPISSSTWFTNSTLLTENDEHDPTLDFGFIRKHVSVGDYVWLDENKDGKQDEGEPGIPGVVLVVTDENGNPVTDVYGNPVGPTTTDGNGYYAFDNLPINNKYIVSIDREASKEALKDLIPTLENSGGRDIDSSTWQAISEFLDQHEQHDPTLDFGFVVPTPDPVDPEPEEPAEPEDSVEDSETPETPEESTEDKPSGLPAAGESVPNILLGLALLILGGLLVLYDKKWSSKQ